MIDFWRFNAFFAQELYHEQPISGPGRLESDGVPPARGLRLRDHPVQLHRDRRQPDDRSRVDGEHGHLEAGIERDAQRLLHAAAARGRRAAAGRDQLRPWRRGRRSPTRCSIRSELAGVHFTGSTEVFNSMWKKIGENIGRYRSYPRLVGETGGKDFIVAHPSADPVGGRRRDRARRVRVSGTEVLGGQPRLRAAVAVERGARPHDRDDERHQDRRRPRLPQLHGRGDRQEGVHARSAGTWTTRRRTRRILQGGDGARRRGLLHRADADRDRRTRLPVAVRGDLRTGRHRLRLSRTSSGRRRSRSSTARHPMR